MDWKRSRHERWCIMSHIRIDNAIGGRCRGQCTHHQGLTIVAHGHGHSKLIRGRCRENTIENLPCGRAIRKDLDFPRRCQRPRTRHRKNRAVGTQGHRAATSVFRRTAYQRNVHHFILARITVIPIRCGTPRNSLCGIISRSTHGQGGTIGTESNRCAQLLFSTYGIKHLFNAPINDAEGIQ